MTRFLAAFVVIAATAPAQVPRGTAKITLNAHSVSIDYGRPSLKGRDMLAKAPVGMVWRLGADQATTMTLTGVTVFGNIVVREAPSVCSYREPRISNGCFSSTGKRDNGERSTTRART